MAQSLNTKVMFITKANVFIGLIGKKHGDNDFSINSSKGRKQPRFTESHS